MPIGAIADAAIHLDQQLGIVRGLKNKLVRQRDAAADKLVTVLEEISKIYGAIDNELSDYLSLYFDGNDQWQDDRGVLVQLEGGTLEIRLGEARGHCHKIGAIHDKYLRRWFDRVLNSDEAQELNAIFGMLSQSDFAMIQQINFLVSWLAPEAEATLDLVDDGKLQEADQRIRTARKRVLPTRRATTKAVAQLRELQAEFIEVSGVP